MSENTESTSRRRLVWVDHEEKIVEEIEPNKCPMCFEVYGYKFHQPKILKCGHSGCGSCLQDWFIKEQNNGGLSCPKCRAFQPGNPRDMKVAVELITPNKELERREEKELLEEKKLFEEALETFGKDIEKYKKNIDAKWKSLNDLRTAEITCLNSGQDIQNDLDGLERELFFTLEDIEEKYKNVLSNYNNLKKTTERQFDDVESMREMRREIDSVRCDFENKMENFNKVQHEAYETKKTKLLTNCRQLTDSIQSIFGGTQLARTTRMGYESLNSLIVFFYGSAFFNGFLNFVLYDWLHCISYIICFMAILWLINKKKKHTDNNSECENILEFERDLHSTVSLAAMCSFIYSGFLIVWHFGWPYLIGYLVYWFVTFARI